MTIKIIVLYGFRAVNGSPRCAITFYATKIKTQFFEYKFTLHNRERERIPPTPILIDWFRYAASNVPSIASRFYGPYSTIMHTFSFIVILHRSCIMNFYLENNKQFMAYYFQCTKYIDCWHVLVDATVKRAILACISYWLSIDEHYENSLVVKFYSLTLQ